MGGEVRWDTHSYCAYVIFSPGTNSQRKGYLTNTALPRKEERLEKRSRAEHLDPHKYTLKQSYCWKSQLLHVLYVPGTRWRKMFAIILVPCYCLGFWLLLLAPLSSFLVGNCDVMMFLNDINLAGEFWIYSSPPNLLFQVCRWLDIKARAFHKQASTSRSKWWLEMGLLTTKWQGLHLLDFWQLFWLYRGLYCFLLSSWLWSW